MGDDSSPDARENHPYKTAMIRQQCTDQATMLRIEVRDHSIADRQHSLQCD